MKKIFILTLLVSSLACQKREKVEIISSQLGRSADGAILEIKILSADKNMITLDDEIAIESVNPDKSAPSALSETKTTSLNVSCDVPGLNRESKKMRLTRNKNYRFLQLVPAQLLSKNKLNLFKNFSCTFSFSYQKNKVKDVGPLVIDNSNYSGNLPLRKGIQAFPRDASDSILPHQLDDVQFDFPGGRAATTTLVCDRFLSREDLVDIRYFQLSRLIYQGVKGTDSVLTGAQNCRLVIEALDKSEEIFISKSFLLVFNKEKLAIEFSSGFSKMSKVARGPQGLLTLEVTNENDFLVAVQMSQLPQQIIWQPVYGVKNSSNGGPVYVMKPNIKIIRWSLTGAQGVVVGPNASFALGPQQRAILVASTQFDVACGEKHFLQSYGPEVPLIGYVVEMDSYKTNLKEFVQGAKVDDEEFIFDGPLQPSFVGYKRWIAVDGIDYVQRLNWFSSGLKVLRESDGESNEIKHCTELI